jgi:hypothetical protein
MSNIGPIIGATITAIAALIVVSINQWMEYRRWKANLKRKGEDAYIDKKLTSLHQSIAELETIKYNTSNLIPRWKGGMSRTQLMDEITKIHSDFNKSVSQSIPYLTDKNQAIEDCTELLKKVSNGAYDSGIHPDTTTNYMEELSDKYGALQDSLKAIFNSFYAKAEEDKKGRNKRVTREMVMLIILILIGILQTITIIKQ